MTSSLLINLSVLIPRPTGISIYATQVFPYLKSLNPTLLVSQPNPDYNSYLIPDNMTPDQGTKGHLRRLLWTQFHLPKIYHKLQSNLLFSPLPETPLFAGCRSIVMTHDLIPLRFPRKFSRLTAYFRYYIPQVLSQAEHIICNSQSTAQDLQDFFKIPSSKITPIPLAYDPQKFHFLNLPTRNYFLYLGRHDHYKNLTGLIQAFAQLSSHQNYELWLAGPEDQTYTPSLKILVQELGLNAKVKFLNYVPSSELTTIINQAIALVFPSFWEGFGFPVLEAMACGTPVITSHLSSLSEVAGDSALLINPYQIEAITEAMNSLIDDPSLRLSLRQKGLERVKLFSWEKTGTMTANLLKKFL